MKKLFSNTLRRLKKVIMDFRLLKLVCSLTHGQQAHIVTPDGTTQCDCCGKGALEVKCLYNYKDKLPDDDETNFV